MSATGVQKIIHVFGWSVESPDDTKDEQKKRCIGGGERQWKSRRRNDSKEDREHGEHTEQDSEIYDKSRGRNSA